MTGKEKKIAQNAYWPKIAVIGLSINFNIYLMCYLYYSIT